MSSSLPPSDNNPRSHEEGAFAAWGLILGFVVGALIGLFTGLWLGVALLGGGLGWVAGACVERSRK